MLTKDSPGRWGLTWVVVLALSMLAACSSPDGEFPIANNGSTETEEPALTQPNGKQSSSGSIIVYAAASLTDAFQEMGKNFERANPGVEVRFSFAGTQVLRTQIEQGGNVDIFASADQKNMNQLIAEHLIDADSVRIFARNRLIVILPKENHAGIDSLQDLARPGTKLVVADPLVPAGGYTRQVISKLGNDPTYGADFSIAVLENVVSNETDVRQVLTKVELGEADAGIVYASDAVAATQIKTLDIPEEFNIVAEYPLGMLSTSQNTEVAEAFLEFVNSPSGQEVLTKWGFMPGK